MKNFVCCGGLARGESVKYFMINLESENSLLFVVILWPFVKQSWSSLLFSCQCETW